jgi:Trypsin-like peptidase domain
MPAPGSVTIALRVKGQAPLAVVVGRAAGWTPRDLVPEDADVALVTFDRYIGVEAPDGEQQSAHFAALEGALVEAGLVISRASSGVTIGGQTDPVSATGILARALSPRGRDEMRAAAEHVHDAEFAGTCFAFRRSNVFLTAAHCVPNDHGLFVNCRGVPTLYEVEQVHMHPDADIALLQLGESVWPGGVEPFVDIGPRPKLGTEFMAYGYPEDFPDPAATEREPTARLFRGWFQRILRYARGSYAYTAGEMSAAVPAGLSGGPLFAPSDFSHLLGIAVENVQSTTYVGRFEEISSDGVVERRIERDLVQYGIAALAEPITEWLDVHVPKRARMP